MAKEPRIAVPGSLREPLPGAKPAGDADPNEQIEITVRLRGRQQISDQELFQSGAQLPADRKVLSHAEFAEKYGADPADIAKIEAFAHSYGLVVVQSSAAARSVRLRGSVANLQAAFGTVLKNYESSAVSYRGREGTVTIPQSLEGIVVGVHGLDNRPVAGAHLRFRHAPKKTAATPRKIALPRNASDGSLSAVEVAKLYNFPTDLDGTGQCIALIELNDTDSSGKPIGSGYSVSDLNSYFSGLGLNTPSVVAVGVDGGANVPGADQNADGEVTLDIEVAGAVAPGATIAVYFAPNSTAGFIDAVNAAVQDTQRNPSVISISWGGPEDPGGQTDSQFLQGLNQAIQDAAQLGITVCVAAGDSGSADMAQQWDGNPHADFPASSPYSLGCGGTRLNGSGTTIDSEVVWNDGTQGGAGGGGVSNVFTLPSYQSNAGVPSAPNGQTGRGVPDLAGNADSATGYRIVLSGQTLPVGGTSAVAPLIAGLLALINQSLAGKGVKPAGFINPLIYSSGASAFRDITSGNNDLYGTLNGLYSARVGWDACSGLGVPDGSKLRVALGA